MPIDYQMFIDEGMRDVVKKLLRHTQVNGLESDQSFYISFYTDDPRVVLSKFVRSQYPEHMTIVLQHQYKNLIVYEDHFSVDILFNGISETISVPFSVLTRFLDPAANFSLQFISTNTIIKDLHQTRGKRYSNTSCDLNDHLLQSIHKTDFQKGKEKKIGKIISLKEFLNKCK